ncbi:MAG: extracellular solute-binding protein, partial [Gemmatimonadota bacterium]|nr:extracellular solute-binding protein [Gemmatimonadota bacterium]
YALGFEKANPGVDVQWLDMGSQEVLERIRAEKANPQADVWFGAPTEMFERATSEGLLQKYVPTWKSAISPAAQDTGGMWYGTYLTPEVIAYNSDKVDSASAPRDWSQVVDPKWKGHVVIRDPVASGTMRAIFGAILQRSIESTRSTDSGWAYLRQLDGNTREYAANPAILYEKLKRGDGWITLYNMPDIATLQQRTGAPVKYMVPSSGTPLLVDAIAVVKGTKHAELAGKFIEYVMTIESLKFAADSLQRIPARNDVPDSILPKWVRDARIQIRPMNVDRRLMADSLNSWMQQWDSKVRNRSPKQ